MEATQTLDVGDDEKQAALALSPALVILWTVDEPERVGEVAMIPSAPSTLGRLDRKPDDDTVRLLFARQRPGRIDETGPLNSPFVSREQLTFAWDEDGSLTVKNVGRAPLRVGKRVVREAKVEAPALLEIEDRLLLGLMMRPSALLPPAPGVRLTHHAFGRADTHGLVGESPAAWMLREQIAFVAPRAAHVLIQGASGTGKELVANGLHALSARARRALVARNAATLPEGLVDAELFGHVRNYPNPGMPERKGLIGEADGSTLFLDEFGELSQSVQAHLLRVLDAGEYTPLGRAQPVRADLRLIAATNRPEESLKHDVLARFKLRVATPDLNQRREDIPLIARGLLHSIAERDPAVAGRFFPDDGSDHPKVDFALMRHLVEHAYTTHVRELETMLWQSLQASRGERLELPSGEALRRSEAPEEDPPIDPNEIDPRAIQESLDRHGGRQEPVWRELGLSSRHVLTRLVKKHDLRVKGR